MHLSQQATAKFLIAAGGETCQGCGVSIQARGMFVSGTSLDPDLGYVGGLFCVPCWMERNRCPENERTLEMAEKDKEVLGIPQAKKFSDLVPTERPWDFVHSSLVNVPITILSIEPITTYYGDQRMCDCLVHGEVKKVLMGSLVLIDQLGKIENDLPVEATIIKVKNYYTFR